MDRATNLGWRLQRPVVHRTACRAGSGSRGAALPPRRRVAGSWPTVGSLP